MNKISIYKYELFSCIFALILGVFLHFAYELSNYNIIVGLFTAINESVWEYLKLIYFPLLITTIIGYILYKNDYLNYLTIKTKSIIISILFTIVFFYTYSGIIGKTFVFIDISLFFISIIIGEVYVFKQIKNNTFENNILSFITLFVLFFMFIIFNYKTPKLNIFKDPINNSYGLSSIIKN